MESSSLNFNQTLDKIYDDVKYNYKTLENSQLNSNTTEYQKIVSNGLQRSLILWSRIQELDLFSKNETVDDMTTESLKYIIVPAMIGHFLYLKIGDDRLEDLKQIKKYYGIFMELMIDYNFIESVSLKSQNQSREEKIKSYKESKILNERLQYLEKHIDEDRFDDEIKREYYQVLIKQWIIKVGNDHKLIDDEIFIHENKSQVKDVCQKDKEKTFKPFVITKNKMSNTVFGMGYKNLPTYSVEDFYIMQVEQGKIPYPSDEIKKFSGGSRRVIPDTTLEDELEKEEKDLLEDTHDVVDRLKKINWDNYKDENRRGCGNTFNRG